MMKLKNLPVAIALGLLTLVATRSRAQCTTRKSTTTVWGDSIALVADSAIEPRIVDEAIQLWSQCANYRGGFPYLAANGSSPMRLTIRLRSTSSRAACATIRGRTITLYEFATLAGQRFAPCGSLAHNLAHEIGHFLGLRDAPRNPTCADAIMATLSPGNRFVRRVRASECQSVGQRWLTPIESSMIAQIGLPGFVGVEAGHEP